MQERHTDRERYFNESAATAAKYYIPFIGQSVDLGILGSDYSVLEVGCGEGGNLQPFAVAGCSVSGIDNWVPRIDEAREIFARKGLQGTFVHTDIFDFHPAEALKFDLIILHDVIEHIADKETLMHHLKGFLKPGGIIFFAFPPWQMPFGGHQQMLNGKIVSRLPYLHLLPACLYRRILKWSGETEGNIGYMMSLRITGLSIEKFTRLAASTGYEVANRRLYLINPHYEAKFGLRPRHLPAIFERIPYLRNFISSTCFWLIRLQSIIQSPQ
jgi:SAM-dependent methyltransferase